MKNFFALVWSVFKTQVILRLGIVGWVLWYICLPIFILVKVVEYFEDQLPEAADDVILILGGWGLLIFLFVRSYRKRKRRRREEENQEL